MTKSSQILGSLVARAAAAATRLASRRIALAADLLLEQARRFEPAAVCLAADDAEPPAAARGAWFRGADGVLAALEHARPDVVLNAITGAAGLRASEWTLRNGLTLALANKESLVMAGSYLTELAVPMKSLGGGLPTRSFHRPISRYVNALADFGFATDAMLELPDLPPDRRPGKAARGDARANAEIPIFLGLRAVRR